MRRACRSALSETRTSIWKNPPRSGTCSLEKRSVRRKAVKTQLRPVILPVPAPPPHTPVRYLKQIKLQSRPANRTGHSRKKNRHGSARRPVTLKSARRRSPGRRKRSNLWMNRWHCRKTTTMHQWFHAPAFVLLALKANSLFRPCAASLPSA